MYTKARPLPDPCPLPLELSPVFSFLRPRRAPVDVAGIVARAGRGEVVVIDVRDGSEIRASGKAKGALHVPMAVLAMKLNPSSPECLPGIDLSTPLALYCASGARSGGAAEALMRMGYTEVYNLGGLYHWQAAGGAVER